MYQELLSYQDLCKIIRGLSRCLGKVYQGSFHWAHELMQGEFLSKTNSLCWLFLRNDKLLTKHCPFISQKILKEIKNVFCVSNLFRL